MKYKNETSSLNGAVIGNRRKSDIGIKIVGLVGKSKVSTTADQKASSIKDYINWKIQKVRLKSKDFNENLPIIQNYLKPLN